MNRRILTIVILIIILLLLLLTLVRCNGWHVREGNLLVNGDAESGEGSPDGTKIIPPPGWTVTSQFNEVRYGASNGYPGPEVPGAPNRGKNFFAGGPNCDVSSATQEVDVSSEASAIDSGAASAVLAGWLGGYESQSDNAAVVAEFINARGARLGKITLGPVTAADRNSATRFVERTTRAILPAGTRKILVTMTMRRTEGSSNDGYADNLSLTLVPAK